MASKQDYYAVLGLKRGASADEIKSAYRRLARELHPDVNKAPDAADRFNKVSEAYEVLSDPEKRQKYDQFGHAGVDGGAGFGGGSGFGGAWGDSGGAGGVGGFGSMFEEIFGAAGRGQGGFRGGGGRHRKAARPQREHDLHVTFVTAVKGGTEQVRMTGGGAERTLEVTVPAGIDDGQKLRVRDRDADVLITVHVGKHPYLRREGLDLLVDLPLTIAEATLGCDVEVPMLKGSVELTVPAASASGSRLRVSGHGIKPAKGKAGDFYAVVKIVPPASLSDEQSSALRALGASLENPRTGPHWPASQPKEA